MKYMEGEAVMFCLECGTLLSSARCSFCGFSNEHFAQHPVVTKRVYPASKRRLDSRSHKLSAARSKPKTEAERKQKADAIREVAPAKRAMINMECPKCGNPQLTFYSM
jgi:DNA-directed RNA polymerase subunit M/transcription elongation factor TFIIS